MPQDVAGARSGEITDAADLKVARVRAEIDAAGPLAVVDQSFIGIARRCRSRRCRMPIPERAPKM
jgi:hypothetical protein